MGRFTLAVNREPAPDELERSLSEHTSDDAAPESTAGHASAHRRHRVLKTVALSVAAVLVVVAAAGFFAYRHLDKNITSIPMGRKVLGTNRPTKIVPKNAPNDPLNILLIGSDTRKGQSGHIGGATPGLSDTTILLHVNAARDLAYGVSLPRDAMVQRPTCERKDGHGTEPGGLSMFNEAYAVGGATCTVKTVEQLTHVHIDHFVVIDFDGFKKMVDALGGVEVCVPTKVNDTTGHIQLPAGTYTVRGQRALDYVRVRHDLGTAENGDIGRMKRQQAFLASMANKAVSAGMLINPIRLYRFLDAATKSLSTDPGLASLQRLGSLARSLQGIGLDHIQFVTVPFESYAPDPNRLQWAPSAHRLWRRIRHDKPLPRRLRSDVTTAASDSEGGGKGGGKGKPGKPSPSPTQTASAEQAAANGLCA
jgi:LCP family protein required for cell wall assembly